MLKSQQSGPKRGVGPLDPPDPLMHVIVIFFVLQQNVRMSIEGIPLGRTGTLEEVAKVILSLASDTHSFTTGVIIPVDGAFTQTIFTSPDIRYPGVEDKE